MYYFVFDTLILCPTPTDASIYRLNLIGTVLCKFLQSESDVDSAKTPEGLYTQRQGTGVFDRWGYLQLAQLQSLLYSFACSLCA